MLLGATNEELAAFFDVAVSTIGKWLAEIPEFATAVRSGKTMADAEVASSLYRRANGCSVPATKIFMVEETITENMGGESVTTATKRERYVPYTEHYPPDTGAAFIWLKNRQPGRWRDKIEHEHSASTELLQILEEAGERAKRDAQ